MQMKKRRARKLKMKNKKFIGNIDIAMRSIAKTRVDEYEGVMRASAQLI